MQLSAAIDPGMPAQTPEKPWYAAPLTALTAVYQQNEINKINLTRAQQGLPPISASAAAPTMNVGMAPDQLNKILWVVGGTIAAAGGLFLLSRMH